MDNILIGDVWVMNGQSNMAFGLGKVHEADMEMATAHLPLHLVDVMAAQAMFPVTSSTEMAGHPGENTQADLAASGDLPATWEFIAAKVRAIPAYVDMFVSVYHDDPNIPVTTAAELRGMRTAALTSSSS